MFVRFLASCLLGCSLVFLALYLAEHQYNHQPLGILGCLLRALPAVVAIVMFIKSRALAEWLSDWLES